jgi:hypothetical protein
MQHLRKGEAMKKSSTTRLTLHRETLAGLERTDLGRAGGALITGDPCTVHCTVTVCGSCKVICE